MDMTQRCPADGCLSLHPSEHSLAMHLFKMGDDDHAEWDDHDETLREVFVEDYALEAGGGEPVEDDGAEPSPNGDEPTVDGPTETEATPSRARTDGGAMPVPDKWGHDDDAEAQVSDDDLEDEPEGCPECGATEWFNPGDLPPSVLEQAPDLADHDRACMPCSTTDEGDLAETVEVYDV